MPLGRFVADFVAQSARLGVEVDGDYHARRRAADARGDRGLVRLGYRVLRFEAALVLERLEPLAQVHEALGRH
jgi:very-short-patch-repair endonuclease